MRILLFLLLSTATYSQGITVPRIINTKVDTFKSELSLDSVLKSTVKPKLPITGVDSVNFWPSTFPIADPIDTHRLDSTFSYVSKPNYSLIKFGLKSGVLDTFNFWPLTPVDTSKKEIYLGSELDKKVTIGQPLGQSYIQPYIQQDFYQTVYLLLYDTDFESIIVRKGYVYNRYMSPGRSFHLEKGEPLPSNYKLITFFD